MARRYHAPDWMKVPLSFYIWIAFVWLILCVAGSGIGYLIHRVAVDPEGAGHFIGQSFVGRFIGGAIRGAQEGR